MRIKLTVLVCGGRDFNDYELVSKSLQSTIREYYFEMFGVKPLVSDIFIIHGAAKGADSLAQTFCINNNVEYKAYPADWDKYGKSAGYKRNTQMLVEGKPDLVIAFPGGKGTSMMCKIAEEAGVDVIRIMQK